MSTSHEKPSTVYVVSADEYEENHVLAVFVDHGEAVRWAGRWERAHRDLPWYARETDVTAYPFVPAGGPVPDPERVA